MKEPRRFNQSKEWCRKHAVDIPFNEEQELFVPETGEIIRFKKVHNLVRYGWRCPASCAFRKLFDEKFIASKEISPNGAPSKIRMMEHAKVWPCAIFKCWFNTYMEEIKESNEEQNK